MYIYISINIHIYVYTFAYIHTYLYMSISVDADICIYLYGSRFGLYKILPSPILYGIWHTKEGSEGGSYIAQKS